MVPRFLELLALSYSFSETLTVPAGFVFIKATAQRGLPSQRGHGAGGPQAQGPHRSSLCVRQHAANWFHQQTSLTQPYSYSTLDTFPQSAFIHTISVSQMARNKGLFKKKECSTRLKPKLAFLCHKVQTAGHVPKDEPHDVLSDRARGDASPARHPARHASPSGPRARGTVWTDCRSEPHFRQGLSRQLQRRRHPNSSRRSATKELLR